MATAQQEQRVALIYLLNYLLNYLPNYLLNYLLNLPHS